jgi:hypothetical protein
MAAGHRSGRATAGVAAGGSIAALYGHACRPPVGVLEALRDRGNLGPGEAALCIAVWLCDVAGWPSLTPRELKAIARAPETRALVPRLRQPADALRSCADSGLLELVAADDGSDDVGVRTITRQRECGVRGPCYRPTPLGRAVAAAGPGRHRGSALRRYNASRRSASAGRRPDTSASSATEAR